MTIRQHP